MSCHGATHFQNCGAFISGSRTAPWKLIIYITKIPVNFAVSAHFIQCGEYLITYSKLAEPNEHEPYKGHVRFGSCSNRTEQTFVVRLKNRTRTVQGACSVRFAYLSNTNRDEQALRCSVRFGSVRRAHSAEEQRGQQDFASAAYR